MAKYHFSEADKERVKQAVKDLEKDSCGEIVPYFVNSSDRYLEASWYLSVVISSFVVLAIGGLSYFWLLPFSLTPFEVALCVLSGSALGFVIPVLFPSAKRYIISSDRQQERVHQRAMIAFLNEKVFATEERVGVLIFVSRLERSVLVLGDEGINARVKQENWQSVVSDVVTGIKSGDVATGLVNAIGQCKGLLLQNGFVRKSTDYNELDDSLRLEE